MPLSTVVSMLGGSTFHHLYSKPSAGSVPSGQLRQAGDRRQQPYRGVASTSPSVSLGCPAYPLMRTREDSPPLGWYHIPFPAAWDTLVTISWGQ